MRRGNYNEFDPNQMVPGEWAVSLSDGNKRIFMCFARPGDVIEVPTVESIVDIHEVEEIRDEAYSYMESAGRYAENAGQSASSASDYKDQAEAATITNITATVDANVGIPSVDVTKTSESPDPKTFRFDFHNIKGETGAKGDRGTDGIDGQDGISISDAYIDDNNHLILVFADSTQAVPHEVDAGDVGTRVVPLTLAEYTALTPEQKADPNIFYWLTDAEGGSYSFIITGTSDYNELENLPSINGVILQGAMTSSTLHIGGETDYENLNNLPSINGHTIIGAMTSSTLGIVGTDESIENIVGHFTIVKPSGTSQDVTLTYDDNAMYVNVVYYALLGFKDITDKLYFELQNVKYFINVQSGTFDESHPVVVAKLVNDISSEINIPRNEGIIKFISKSSLTTGISCFSNPQYEEKTPAFGDGCFSTGRFSHVFGEDSVSAGRTSFAEGVGTAAIQNYSHAEGYFTTAMGNGSHAEGHMTVASGNYSHTGGYYTKTTQNYQTAIGEYNAPQTNTLLEVGNGSANNARSNAFEVYQNGDINAAGNIKIGGDKLFRPNLYRIKAHVTGNTISVSAREHFAQLTFQTNTAWDTWFSKYNPIILMGSGEAYTSSSWATEIMVLPKAIYKAPSGVINVKFELYNTSDVTYNIEYVYVFVLAVICDTSTGSSQDIT